MTKPRTFLALLTLLVCTPVIAAAPGTFRLEPYRDTVAVHATVAGHDGYFTLDTGGGVTLLTPEFARKVGCRPWGRLTGYAMMGNRIDAPRCEDVAFSIGSVKAVAPTIAVLDVMSFFPKDAAPLDGSIALNAFDGKAITIDFPRMTVTVETPSSLRRRLRGAVELPMRAQREAQGQALAVSVGVPSSEGRVWMELDTGNSRTILVSKPYAKALGLDPDTKDAQQADFAVAEGIRVHGRTFTPDMIIDGNLGMPFLKDMVVTIDLSRSRLWMKK